MANPLGDPVEEKRLREEHLQAMYKAIAILTQRLGGRAVITKEEFANPPIASLTREYTTGEVIIELEATDGERS